MSQWSERILSHFTADLTRLWVACDPDDVLLDEKLLSELRSRGFEVMLYEDPFVFRAEYEGRYRAAWDRGEAGPAPSLVLHLRSADANVKPMSAFTCNCVMPSSRYSTGSSTVMIFRDRSLANSSAV